MRVTVNPSGRTLFLALVLVALLLTGVLGVAIAGVDAPQRWLPALAAVIAALAFIYLLAVAFSGLLYCLRLINVTLMGALAIGAAVIDGMLFQFLEHRPVLLVISVSVLVIYLVGMALLLLPDPHSDLAHRMHPFVAEADLGDITLDTTGRTHRRHGKKRIKHREVSIFEDWPAPVPFPAQALYSYRTGTESELSFSRGDQLIILDCRGNWWQAKHPKTGRSGFVPSNYIQVLQKAKVRKSFEAKDQDETSVLEGQEIEVMEVHEFMSLVRSVDGKIGSVPTDCLVVDPINLTTLKEN